MLASSVGICSKAARRASLAPRVVRSGAAHALASDASTPLRRAASCRVPLHAAVFGEPGGRERAIVEHDGGLRASAFTYSTGVAAVRVESDVGEMVVLPFQGQQVWRLRFGEEQLAMRTMFDEPRPVDPMGRMTYLNTYGAFLLHCGAMRMGVPGPEDDHPLHGELPNAKYDEAWLDMGEDDQGAYIAVGGEYRHMAAMSHHYTATARATLRDGVQRLPVSMTVHNRHTNPMDLMFMHHANFWPVKGSRLVYSAPSTPDSAKVRTSIPAHVSPTEEYLALLDRLAKDPSLIDNISEELLESASPELVCYYDYLADSDGWAHTMQRLPQGGAHYLKHKPSQMSECVRWLTYDESFQALGMALPSTCGPEGYTIEKEKGTVKSLAAGDTAVFDVEAGLLTEADADDVERHIEGILG